MNFESIIKIVHSTNRIKTYRANNSFKSMPKKDFHIVAALIVLILGGVILGLSLKPKPQPLSTPQRKKLQ